MISLNNQNPDTERPCISKLSTYLATLPADVPARETSVFFLLQLRKENC